jgi:Zn ribbon nucleic-acid-binding protein
MRKQETNNLMMIIGGVAVLLVGYAMYYWYNYTKTPGDLDNFAACLTEKGAKFYGAYWCPHCQVQKAMFGKSKDKIPYIECSTADGKGQTEECTNAGITGYPTWIFADMSSSTGEQALEVLAEKTGCVLPSSTTQ